AGIRSFNESFESLESFGFFDSCGSAASRASESAGSAPAFAGRTGAFEGALGRALESLCGMRILHGATAFVGCQAGGRWPQAPPRHRRDTGAGRAAASPVHGAR